MTKLLLFCSFASVIEPLFIFREKDLQKKPLAKIAFLAAFFLLHKNPGGIECVF